MERFNVFTVIMIFIGVIAGVGVNIFGIWTLVEIILYLAEDDPFNLNSLYATVGMFFIMIVAWLISLFNIYKDK